MNILIVCHYVLPHVGGIEKVVDAQSKELVKRGHTVTIISSLVPHLKNYQTSPGIKVVRLWAWDWFEDRFGIPFPIFSPSIIWKTASYIQSSDIIHVHGHIYLSSFIACMVAKLYKKKIVLTQQNTFIEHRIPFVRWIEHICDYTAGRYILSSADLVIAASKKTKKYIYEITRFVRRCIVRYNGIDTEKYHPKRTNQMGKRSAKHSFICFTIRRITFKNGIHTFLQIAEKMKRHANIQFVLGGTGPDFPKVQEYIDRHQLTNIHLTGYIPDSSLPEYYQNANVFILPSEKGEGFPLVVLEALSSGVPVIATKSGGHEEIIRDGITGYLVNTGDVKKMSQKILYLYRNKKKLATMAATCRSIVEGSFTWKRHVEDLERQYTALLSYDSKK